MANILDKLNKVLKTRQDALKRFDRRSRPSTRSQPWDEKSLRAFRESSRLVDDLGQSAAIEYDRILRSRPGKRVEREAIRLMPDDIVEDYFPDNGWY